MGSGRATAGRYVYRCCVCSSSSGSRFSATSSVSATSEPRIDTLLGLLALAVALIAAAAACSAVVQERAMSRCGTPPGLSRKPMRAEITVEWKVFPFSYRCVYVTPDDIGRRRPP